MIVSIRGKLTRKMPEEIIIEIEKLNKDSLDSLTNIKKLL